MCDGQIDGWKEREKRKGRREGEGGRKIITDSIFKHLKEAIGN